MTCQHGRDSKGGHGNSQKSPPHKSSDFDKYSDYSDDKYDYDEEEDDYEDDMSEYSQSKDSQCQGKGRHAKDQMKRGSMRGMKQQQCMSAFQIHTLLISDHYCCNLSRFIVNDNVFDENVIFSWAERKRQREWARKRTWDAQQKQEAEGETLGRTRARSRRRPMHGRHGTGMCAV